MANGVKAEEKEWGKKTLFINTFHCSAVADDSG